VVSNRFAEHIQDVYRLSKTTVPSISETYEDITLPNTIGSKGTLTLSPAPQVGGYVLSLITCPSNTSKFVKKELNFGNVSWASDTWTNERGRNRRIKRNIYW
jgi:hypothetical protein